MSCECEHDSVLELLEALAEARGYQLVLKGENLLSVFTDELQVQFDELPTDQVIIRVQAFSEQVKRLEQALESVRRLYDQRQHDLTGLWMPDAHKVTPPLLSAELQIARQLSSWGRHYLAKRLVDDYLVEITGAEDPAQAIAILKRLAEPAAPANPDAA